MATKRKRAYQSAGSSVMKKRKYQSAAIRRSINSSINTFAINTSGTISTTGSILDLGQIAVGAGPNNRYGNRVYLEKLWMCLQCVVADTTNVMRAILFLDKRANGAGLSITDVLDTSNFNAPLNYANKERFTILMDRSLALSTQGPASINIQKMFNVSKVIDYASSSTAIATQNHPYLLLISDSAAPAHPSYTLGTNMYFTP